MIILEYLEASGWRILYVKILHSLKSLNRSENRIGDRVAVGIAETDFAESVRQ